MGECKINTLIAAAFLCTGNIKFKNVIFGRAACSILVAAFLSKDRTCAPGSGSAES